MTSYKQKFDPTTRVDTRQQKIVGYIATPQYDAEVINELFGAIDENNFTKVFDLIVTQHVPVTVLNEKHETVLHVVLLKDVQKFSESTKISMINKIPNYKTLILIPNQSGVTPLHIASQFQYAKIIKMFCEKRIDVNVVDMNGMSPLHYAVLGYIYPCSQQRQIKLDKMYYIEDNIDGTSDLKIVEEQNSQLNNTRELFIYNENKPQGGDQMMCVKTSIETIKELINFGASTNLRDKDGMTPFFYILRNNDVDLLEKYSNNIKNISFSNPKNVYYQTPYDYFASYCLSYINKFNLNNSTRENITSFTLQYFGDNTEISKKYITYYKELLDSIAIKSCIMVDDQIKSLIGYDVCGRLMIYANGIDDILVYPITKMFSIAQNSASRNAVDDIYIAHIQKQKCSSYNKQWDDYIAVLANNGEGGKVPQKLHMFVECWNKVLKNYIVNPITTSSTKRTSDLEYIHNKIAQIVDTYNYISFNDNENFVVDKIVKIIAHIIHTTICYKMYVEMIIMQAECNIKNKKLELKGVVIPTFDVFRRDLRGQHIVDDNAFDKLLSEFELDETYFGRKRDDTRIDDFIEFLGAKINMSDKNAINTIVKTSPKNINVSAFKEKVILVLTPSSIVDGDVATLNAAITSQTDQLRPGAAPPLLKTYPEKQLRKIMDEVTKINIRPFNEGKLQGEIPNIITKVNADAPLQFDFETGHVIGELNNIIIAYVIAKLDSNAYNAAKIAIEQSTETNAGKLLAIGEAAANTIPHRSILNTMIQHPVDKKTYENTPHILYAFTTLFHGKPTSYASHPTYDDFVSFLFGITPKPPDEFHQLIREFEIGTDYKQYVTNLDVETKKPTIDKQAIKELEKSIIDKLIEHIKSIWKIPTPIPTPIPATLNDKAAFTLKIDENKNAFFKRPQYREEFEGDLKRFIDFIKNKPLFEELGIYELIVEVHEKIKKSMHVCSTQDNKCIDEIIKSIEDKYFVENLIQPPITFAKIDAFGLRNKFTIFLNMYNEFNTHLKDGVLTKDTYTKAEINKLVNAFENILKTPNGNTVEYILELVKYLHKECNKPEKPEDIIISDKLHQYRWKFAEKLDEAVYAFGIIPDIPTIKSEAQRLNKIENDRFKNWGYDMATEVVKAIFDIHPTEETQQEKKDIGAIIDTYVKANGGLYHGMAFEELVVDKLTVIPKVDTFIKDYNNFLTHVIKNIKSLMDNYFEYLGSGVQYTKMLLYILKHYT